MNPLSRNQRTLRSFLRLPIDWCRRWFNPSDPDPRNRTLRYLTAAMLLGGTVALILNLTYYVRPETIFWTVVSLFPNTESLVKGIHEPILQQTGRGLFHETLYYRFVYLSFTLGILTAMCAGLISAWQTYRGHLQAASSVIVGAFGCIVAITYLLPGDPKTMLFILPGAMQWLFMAGFLLSRRTIFVVLGIIIILIPTMTLLAGEFSGSAPESFGTLLAADMGPASILLIEAFLLYGFRVEFDNRANALERAKRAELERERWQELDRVKNDFLYSMSHELRTPLHSIIGLSSCILNGVDGDLVPDLQEDIVTIENSGRYLLSLVNNILDLAKLEAGTIRLDIKPLDLAEVVLEALRVVQPQVETKGLTLINNVPAAIPAVLGDRQAVAQVLLNLLNNAIKFTSQGSIEICAALELHAVVVCVKDTGIGILPEHQPHIFDKFYQVAKTYRKSEIGLGLSISKRLINLQGGEVWVASAPGQGSTFSFSLPVLQDAMKEMQLENTLR